MLFTGGLYRYIPKLLGLTSLSFDTKGEDVNEATNEHTNFRVRAYWMAEIRYYQYKVPFDELVIAIVKSDKWRKGVILVPEKPFEHKFDAPLPYLIKPIDLGSWYDPTSKTLQEVNLYPENDPAKKSYLDTGIGREYEFCLEFGTYASSGRIRLSQPSQDSKFNNLMHSLHETVLYMTHLYNDEHITRYVLDEISRY